MGIKSKQYRMRGDSCGHPINVTHILNRECKLFTYLCKVITAIEVEMFAKDSQCYTVYNILLLLVIFWLVTEVYCFLNPFTKRTCFQRQ